MRHHLDTTEKVRANFRQRHGENMSAGEWAAHFGTIMDSPLCDVWNCVFGGEYTNPEFCEFVQLASIDVNYDEIAKTGDGRLFVARRFQKRAKLHARSQAPISFT